MPRIRSLRPALRRMVPTVRQMLRESFGEQSFLGAPPPPTLTRSERIEEAVEYILAASPCGRTAAIAWHGKQLGHWDKCIREWSRDVLTALLPRLEAKAS